MPGEDDRPSPPPRAVPHPTAPIGSVSFVIGPARLSISMSGVRATDLSRLALATRVLKEFLATEDAIGLGEPPAVDGAPASRSDSRRARDDDGPPDCPIHRRPMKPSREGAGWFCPAKQGRGYCQEVA